MAHPITWRRRGSNWVPLGKRRVVYHGHYMTEAPISRAEKTNTVAVMHEKTQISKDIISV